METSPTCEFGDDACGDNAGYFRRNRNNKPTCSVCKAAHADYVRIRRAVKQLEMNDNA